MFKKIKYLNNFTTKYSVYSWYLSRKLKLFEKYIKIYLIFILYAKGKMKDYGFEDYTYGGIISMLTIAW